MIKRVRALLETANWRAPATEVLTWLAAVVIAMLEPWLLKAKTPSPARTTISPTTTISSISEKAEIPAAAAQRRPFKEEPDPHRMGAELCRGAGRWGNRIT